MPTTLLRDDALDDVFAALANPTRRAMIARLTEGDATVSELAEPFRMSMPAISKHLSVLERAGLIRREREAQFRRCRLEPEVLAAASSWVDTQRRVWETSFDRLERRLDEATSARPADGTTITTTTTTPEGPTP